MNRRKQEPRVHADRWLISYADLITLLFAFFVVLYASSQVDRQKMLALSHAIGEAFEQLGTFQEREKSYGNGMNAAPETNLHEAPGRELRPLKQPRSKAPNYETDVVHLKEELAKALAKEMENRSVALRVGPDGLVISLREMGFFESGSASMRRDAEPVFRRIVTLLRRHECAIRLEGHTDNVPIHTSQIGSNWELSTARATTMVRQLITVYGFSPAQLSAAGYAEFHPIASNSTAEGRRLNRRIDIVVLRSGPMPAEAGSAAQAASAAP